MERVEACRLVARLFGEPRRDVEVARKYYDQHILDLEGEGLVEITEPQSLLDAANGIKDYFSEHHEGRLAVNDPLVRALRRAIARAEKGGAPEEECAECGDPCPAGVFMCDRCCNKVSV